MMIKLLGIVLAGAVVVALVVYYLLPAVAVAAMQALARSASGLRKKSIAVGEIDWVYLDSGKAESEALLLLHGFGANKENWVSYARYLSKHYRVICPDLPGFGESTKNPELVHDPKSQARRLHDFVEALGIDSVHLAGNSMGGMITLRYALDYPQNIASITLIAPGGIAGTNKSELDLALARGENPLLVQSEADVETLLAYSLYEPIKLPRPFRKVVLAEARKNQQLHSKIFEDMALEISQAPLENQLGGINTPTLIIWGREDRLLDVSAANVLSARLPNNQCLIMEKTGHLPMMERPQESALAQLELVHITSRA